MNSQAPNPPPHEQFGFAVLQRVWAGEKLRSWENDYARLFWQSLEVHNGGFQQWIGNTGIEGALETLEILDRYGLSESHRVTQLAFQIIKLESYREEQSLYDHLEANVANWFEQLRPLDEAYWDDADTVDTKLIEIFRLHMGPNSDTKGVD